MKNYNLIANIIDNYLRSSKSIESRSGIGYEFEGCIYFDTRRIGEMFIMISTINGHRIGSDVLTLEQLLELYFNHLPHSSRIEIMAALL